MRKLTALDIYQAAFHAHNRHAQTTVNYVSGFAWNVFNINLTGSIITQIIEAREAWLARESAGGATASDYYNLVSSKLCEIQLDDIGNY